MAYLEVLDSTVSGRDIISALIQTLTQRRIAATTHMDSSQTSGLYAACIDLGLTAMPRACQSSGLGERTA